MTRVRGLMWVGLAVASAGMVAVVTAATAPRVAESPRRIEPVAAPAPVPSAPPRRDAEPPSIERQPAAVIDRQGMRADPDGVGQIPGVVPGSELGEGDATVRLRLLGFEDKNPVAMPVRLWRLGVPESETWTAGDQVQAEIDVGPTGVRLARLPAGRYRVECRDARPNATDPPEFVLADGESTADLAVQHRRPFRLRLRLVDADGAVIGRANQRPFGGGSGSGSSDWPPSWAIPREPKGVRGDDVYGGGFSFGTGCGRSGPWKPVVADADGCVDLGTIRERGANSHRVWTDEFAADATGAVRVSMDDKTPVDSTYVGVAPRLDVLVAHVICPDGSKLDPSTAKIEATSNATRCAWTPPADTWRTVSVDVTVVRDGCAPLTFDWTAATADAEHRLVATDAGK